MKILLTNDDGIYARGLQTLYQQAKAVGDVVVVAPETEQSAVGHAITLYSPLRIKKVSADGEFSGYAVNGTPADCVKLALSSILTGPPDLLISGINLGQNTGANILYSGTVSAAIEGTLRGISSLAVSVVTSPSPDFEHAARFTLSLVPLILSHGLPPGTLLNVNIPAVPERNIRGVRVTRQARSRFEEFFHKRLDPQNREYYWLDGTVVNDDEDGTDTAAVKNSEISITPVHYDITDYSAMEKIKEWNIRSTLDN